MLDGRERRLTLGDAPVELTAKSLETLLHLVRSPGRLLSRHELLDAVWPDAVVEEGNLHWTVSAVRKALALHDPGRPYIETVRGFGYRFVQPVSAQALVEVLAPLPPDAAAVPVADHECEARPTAPGLRRPRGGLVPPPALRVALFALLIALGTLAVSHGARVAPPTGRRTLAVVGFRNLSGRSEDAWLATAFAEMLAADLSSGPALRALPGDDVARLRRELALPEAAPFARDSLTRVAHNAGVDWVVSGTYVVLPGDERRLRLDARLDDTATGETIASASGVAREAELFELVGVVGDELRQALGVRATGGASRGAVPSLERAAQAALDYADVPPALSCALGVPGDEARSATVATGYAQTDDHAQALLHARGTAGIARHRGEREIQTRALPREAFTLPRAERSIPRR